jgi:hypothetical protein
MFAGSEEGLPQLLCPAIPEIHHDGSSQLGQQSGSLLYDPSAKVISGVSWQNPDREEVKKEFRDGRVVSFSNQSTLIMYPMIVLGGGDTEWVACVGVRDQTQAWRL